MIDQFVEFDPPRADGKGQYERTRLMNRPGRGRDVQVAVFDNEESPSEEEHSANEYDQEIRAESSPASRRRRKDDEDSIYAAQRPAKKARHMYTGLRRDIGQGRHAAHERPRSFSSAATHHSPGVYEKLYSRSPSGDPPMFEVIDQIL